MIGFRQNICYDGVSHLIWGEDHYIFINNSLLHPPTIGSVIVYSIFVNFGCIKLWIPSNLKLLVFKRSGKNKGEVSEPDPLGYEYIRYSDIEI